eukprot:4343366-Amphidinium_carterae.1
MSFRLTVFKHCGLETNFGRGCTTLGPEQWDSLCNKAARGSVGSSAGTAPCNNAHHTSLQGTAPPPSNSNQT